MSPQALRALAVQTQSVYPPELVRAANYMTELGKTRWKVKTDEGQGKDNIEKEKQEEVLEKWRRDSLMQLTEILAATNDAASMHAE